MNEDKHENPIRMNRAIYKTIVTKEAWEHWEKDNAIHPQGINPHAYVLGYLAAKILPPNHPDTFDENGIVKDIYYP